MSSRIESSLSDIRSSFSYYEKYKKTYHILKSIPLFKKMEKRNKKLKEENLRLREENAKLLDTLCFIQSGGSRSCKSKKRVPIRELMKIKKEQSTQVDDEVIIVDEPTLIPNITYHVIDDDETFLENKKNIQVSVLPIEEEEAAEEEGDEEGEEEEEQEEEEEGDEEGEEEEEQEEGEEEEEQEEGEEEEEQEEQEEQEAEDEVVEEEEAEEEVEEEEVEEEEEEAEEEVEEEEEEVEEEAEEEEAVEEEEEEEAEECEVECEVEEEEADEVESVMINNKEYYTTNSTNGVIYNVDENGDITDEVGVFKNGVATFYSS